MKPPVGAVTNHHVLMKLLAKAKEKPIKVFLVWFAAQKWVITIIEFNDKSYIRGNAIYDVMVSNHPPASSCSFSPCLKDHAFCANYWYFRNYWHAYAYLRQIQTKSPDHY